MFRLDQKTAFITGAGSGIGRAMAELFADQGATIYVAERNEAAAQATVARIRERGGQAEIALVDVSDAAAVAALAAGLPPLDLLVNNAGINHIGDVTSTTADDLDRLHAVNVRGPFNCCHAFVPAMLERRAGSVINLASIGGVMAVRERLAYTTTKFALVGMTKALALDHSSAGVRFNAICPGRVETKMIEQLVAQSSDPEATYRKMAATQLNGRMASPAEIAAAALYLASEASAMVTGSTLMIDGGWSVGK